MNLVAVQQKVAERVREIPILSGLPVFAEEFGNVVENVQNAVARQCFCVVVGSPSFSDESPDSSICFGSASVVVSVFENPALNRRVSGRPSYLAAAQEVAKALKLFDTGDGILTSPVIADPTDLGEGVVSVTITLKTKVTL